MGAWKRLACFPSWRSSRLCVPSMFDSWEVISDMVDINRTDLLTERGKFAIAVRFLIRHFGRLGSPSSRRVETRNYASFHGKVFSLVQQLVCPLGRCFRVNLCISKQRLISADSRVTPQYVSKADRSRTRDAENGQSIAFQFPQRVSIDNGNERDIFASLGFGNLTSTPRTRLRQIEVWPRTATPDRMHRGIQPPCINRGRKRHR